MAQQDESAFDRLVGHLDYPMYVVTTAAGSERAGCLVGFATQSSIDPPRFLVALSRRNHTFTVSRRAEHLAVHLLPRTAGEVAESFGTQTGDRVDKFATCDWRTGPAGMPILTVAEAWFVGEIVARFDLGDHVGHLLRPIAATAPERLAPWVSFTDVRHLDPGHQA